GGVKTDTIVDLQHGLLGDLQPGAGLAVVVVVERHEGVEAVVAAVKLDDDEDAALGPGVRFGGDGTGRARQEQWHAGAASYQGRGAEAQKVAAGQAHEGSPLSCSPLPRVRGRGEPGYASWNSGQCTISC